MPSHEIGRIRPGHERGTPGWFQRDSRNQYRASLRNRDQLANRPSGSATSARVPPSTSIRPRRSSASLNHPDGGVTTLIPGFLAADPFRTIPRWTEQGRGSVIPVKFIADDRAQPRGHVFLAPQTWVPSTSIRGRGLSLSSFLSGPRHRFGGSYNPAFATLNHNRVAIAGHLLGAAAVRRRRAVRGARADDRGLR